jgi:hypothetical protein
MAKIFEYFSFFLVASLPFLIAIYDTANGQIYGSDSWYWLKVSGIPLWLFNLFPIALYGLIISLFYRAEGYVDNRLILLTIFLSNIFVVRFLEFELDDFVMYAILLPIFAVNPKKFVWLSIPIVILYSFIHGWALGISNMFSLGSGSGIAESIPNIFMTLFAFLPTIFLFVLNSKWKYFIVLIILLALFAIPKVSNPLPLFVLPAYLSMMGEKIKFSKYLILGFCIITFIMIFLEAVREVEVNTSAFQKYCNTTIKICYNYDEKDWYFGHYFAYLGYKNYAEGFGVCKCVGIECINQTEWC